MPDRQTDRQTEHNKSVAIITSTIGRKELKRTIESVKNQTYPCKHYIFVDGEQFTEKAKAIVKKYDDLIVTYLPMNTGKNGWVNSSINAIAPFLVKEDIVCYLDDDNWYEPNHIETIIEKFNQCPDADFVYTLRNFVLLDGAMICPDDIESLGVWENKLVSPTKFLLTINGKEYNFTIKLHTTHHIDTNCYAFKHKTAVMLSQTWFSGQHNDKNIFKQICDLNLRCAETKEYTVNYVIDPTRYLDIMPAIIRTLPESNTPINRPKIIQQVIEFTKILGKENIKRHNGKRHWAK